MNFAKLNKILFKTANFSGYALAFLAVLYFISGYGMTKGIIDPVFAKFLHNELLPLPFIVFFILHSFLHLKFKLRRWFRSEIWLWIYIAVLGLVVLIFLVYLYLL